MDYMYSGLIAVIDLESEEVEEVELEEDFIREHLGGASANLALYEEYSEDNPIILGTGILTGSLASGSSLGVMTAKSPLTGEIQHAPFVWFTGPELKFTGFDFVVIKGVAADPVYLWIHDEIVDINSAGDLWGMDTWGVVDHIRDEQGEERVQVLAIGAAGENKLPYAQVTNNYWVSGDFAGFGAIFGEKNLKAVAFRGMGEVDIADPEGFVEKAASLLDSAKADIDGRKGPEWIVEKAGYDINGIESFVHRYDACFNCPYPCQTFVKYNEDPKTMDRGVDEPGVLITELSGLSTISQKLSMEESLRAIEKCARLGLNPAVAGALIDTLADLETIASSEAEIGGVAGGSFIPEIGTGGKVGLVLGICPVLMLLVPAIDKASLVELVNLGCDWDLTVEELDEVVDRL